MRPIGQFRPKPPYNFAALTRLLSRFPHPTVDIVIEGGVWRVLRHADGLALVVARGAGDVENPLLDVSLAAHTGDPDPAALLAKLGAMLAVDADAADFWRMARDDETLWPVVEPLYGLPSTRTESAFEAIAMTIIEQHIAWKAARRSQRWLVEWASQRKPPLGDERLAYDGRIFYAFPSPARIARSTLEELKPLKITDGRIRLLIEVAQQVDAGALDLDGLGALPPQDAYDALCAIKGVGHWTAAVTLARAFGWRDTIPHNDAALQAAVNHYFYGETGRASAETLVETLGRYGEHAGAAADVALSRWVIDFY